MRRRSDLLVLGGGPAGSTVAAWAAAAGCAVTVVDQARFPRDKVCGEFLSSEGCRVLERIGLLGGLIAQGAVPINRFRIGDASGRSIEAPLPAPGDPIPRALGVSRALLDRLLLEHAAARGARVLERCRALRPIVEGGRVEGAVVRAIDGRSSAIELRATLVVAADGRRSMLARALHPDSGDPSTTHTGSWFGLKTHVGGAPGELADRVELQLFDGGYVGLAAVDGGRINVCLMTRVAALRACGGSPDRLLSERILANPAVARVLGGSERCGRWHAIGPLAWGPRRPAAAGALFVGDAAGTIDPFSGLGISNALRAAELVSDTVLVAVDRGALEPGAARAYARRWRASFAPLTRRVRVVGSLFERPRLAVPLIGWLRGAGSGWLPRLLAATRAEV
ncbi:MAG TPA: NAD(P)/FAD-dependent oxidoreductase [Candidatus Polarisedimenticolaceae bacterium]|nr:NAD(P)/FAD-dependent oxidoreductase [Candidatus Polarisedimenticolaceae bacterium]